MSLDHRVFQRTGGSTMGESMRTLVCVPCTGVAYIFRNETARMVCPPTTPMCPSEAKSFAEFMRHTRPVVVSPLFVMPVRIQSTAYHRYCFVMYTSTRLCLAIRSAYARALGFENDIVWLPDEATGIRKSKRKKKKKKKKGAGEQIASEERWGDAGEQGEGTGDSDDVCNVDNVVVADGDSGAESSLPDA